MADKASAWKKGRGRLGILSPLLGKWIAMADTPMGKVQCTRTFRPILHGTYIQLTAEWNFGKGVYEEHAIYGIRDGKLGFWSFTSDGKKSEGSIADGTDVHPQAIAFEAKMPAGLARMIYWPGDDGTITWAVESKAKKGWKRFSEHHYRPGSRTPDPLRVH
jgi:hypothetical protein